MDLESISNIASLLANLVTPVAGIILAIFGWKKTGEIDLRKTMEHAEDVIEIVQKLIKAAELVGVKIKVASLGGGSFLEKIVGLIGGGTDATAFSKSNIKASSITALNLLKIVSFYHQETDTPDKIEKGVLENTLKICIGYLLSESKKD